LATVINPLVPYYTYAALHGEMFNLPLDMIYLSASYGHSYTSFRVFFSCP